jgi:hypothetical protein
LNQAAARRGWRGLIVDGSFFGLEASSASYEKIDGSSIVRFAQFVELKDFKPPTKKEYVRYVRRLADHFRCDPATLCEDQLRQYFLFLRQEKKLSGSALS